MSEHSGHPREIRADMKAAVRLEWWHIGWALTYIAALGLTAGSSQAMKTAWIEDMLGLIAPIVFLISERYERRSANKRFQYGYDRVNGLGFLIAAVTLASVGLLLLYDAVTALAAQERATIGTTRIMGHDVWLGWFMLAAQAYAAIPPLIIGHKQLPLAMRLRDKLLHTDALTNKANWQTGVAGFVGVALLGFGLWWADAAAAAIISAGIIWDGWRALKVAIAELNDGVPHDLEGGLREEDAKAIAKALKARFPGAKVLLRETGRYIRAEVVGAAAPKGFKSDDLDIEGLEARWRLDSIAFRP